MCALDVGDIRRQVERLRTAVRKSPSVTTPPPRATLEMVRSWEDTVAEYGNLLRRLDILQRDVHEIPDEAAAVRDSLLIDLRDIRARAFAVMRTINPDQAWFWTQEWQDGEREADADIVAGRTTIHASTDDFLTALDSRRSSRADT